LILDSSDETFMLLLIRKGASVAAILYLIGVRIFSVEVIVASGAYVAKGNSKCNTKY
jgi:hypothetical protein